MTQKTNTEVTQEKSWTKNKKGSYIFTVDGVEKGTMKVSANTLDAAAELGGKTYKIKKTSVWKLNVAVTDESGKEIVKINQEKWFSSKSELVYNFKKYKLTMRNKYYASYILLDGEREVLTYSMTTKKCIPSLKITGSTEEKDFILDFVLWYLYAPIIHEVSGEDISFLLMAVA